MSLGEKIRDCRKQQNLSQEQLAKRLHVSRQAVTKWETGRGFPDIENLIALSDEFGLSLDELIKNDLSVQKKIVADSRTKKRHLLVILYLISLIVFFVYFAIAYRILMLGVLIATLFMLFFEVRIFVREKIYRKDGF